MASNKNVEVAIPAIEIKMFTVKLVGDSPLIVHAWSEKAKKEMLDKQMKKASKGKAAKDPFKDYVDSLYWLTEKPENPTQEDVQKAKFGFPSVAFKACAVSAAYRSGIVGNKVSTNSAFHIMGDMIEIIGTPEIREDMVRIAMTVDIRYRGEFKNWSANLNIRYNANAISMEQIINYLNLGGFGVGLGEWRAEKGGNFGMFHVE